MAKFQNKDVTVVRDAKQGDPGFKPGEPMVIVKGEDGKEQTVPKSQVSGAEGETAAANQGERRGGPTQAQT